MRSVYLLPSLLDPRVQAFRERYDPLATKIGPHITVAFPFDAELGDLVLIDHVKAVLARRSPFRASLGEVKGSKDGSIYFVLAEGATETREIAQELDRLLPPQAILSSGYEPHLTIARVSEDEREAAMGAARALKVDVIFRVYEAMVERIADDAGSRELAKVPLGQ